MIKYIISACLAGVNCKYDGGNNLKDEIAELIRNGEAVLICPEQMGGMPTPRPAAEINGDKVINICGEDVTHNFEKGAQEALRIAKLYNATHAVLKERSPSCGVNFIYDGSHQGKKISGKGFTTRLLEKHGINIVSEEEFIKLLNKEKL